MTQTEALKLALEALEIEQAALAYEHGKVEHIENAITSIKEALAQPEQEPVAWITQSGKGWLRWHKSYDDNKDSVPLYTTPPQRTWVGLTDEELPALAGDNGKYMELQQVRRFYKYIEAKLKEKNT